MIHWTAIDMSSLFKKQIESKQKSHGEELVTNMKELLCEYVTLLILNN